MYDFVKRCFDLVLATVLAIVLVPVIAVISILLKIDGMNSPFFIQKRLGKDERMFKIRKFKTMTDEVDETGEWLPDEDRITRLGAFLRKTSLDELPTLINVFTGEMSFVGPRPLLEEYLPLYTERERKRHLVRPGITGWAQVNGRNSVGWDDKFEMDVWYVENRSLLLDLKILAKTAIVAVSRRDVSAEGRATMIDLRDVRDTPGNGRIERTS